MARRKKQRSTVYVVSVAAHLLVGAVLALIPQDRLREVVAIALNEAKQEKKAEPPKPPQHAAERPSHAPGHNVRPVAAARAVEASAQTDAPVFTDIGIALDSSSSDGVAVNIAPRQMAVAIAPVVPVKPKVLVAQRTEAACTEDLVKARPLSMVRPSYTDGARHARVQGRVKIELFVNENGEVTNAKLLEGLGYGLDEAALDAVRRLRFSPATLCKKAVAAPFVIAMRFVLPT
jgi:protein TonB